MTQAVVCRSTMTHAAMCGMRPHNVRRCLCTRHAGVLNTTTTSASGPSLAGNITAIVVSAAVCIIWTLIKPDRNASWDTLRASMDANVQVLDNVKVRPALRGSRRTARSRLTAKQAYHMILRPA